MEEEGSLVLDDYSVPRVDDDCALKDTFGHVNLTVIITTSLLNRNKNSFGDTCGFKNLHHDHRLGSLQRIPGFIDRNAKYLPEPTKLPSSES